MATGMGATGKVWLLTFVGYTVNLLAVPALALAGSWPAAAALVIAERVGRPGNVVLPKAKVASSTRAGGAALILEEQRKNDGVRPNPWQRCGALGQDQTRRNRTRRDAGRGNRTATGNGKLCSPRPRAFRSEDWWSRDQNRIHEVRLGEQASKQRNGRREDLSNWRRLSKRYGVCRSSVRRFVGAQLQ